MQQTFLYKWCVLYRNGDEWWCITVLNGMALPHWILDAVQRVVFCRLNKQPRRIRVEILKVENKADMLSSMGGIAKKLLYRVREAIKHGMHQKHFNTSVKLWDLASAGTLPHNREFSLRNEVKCVWVQLYFIKTPLKMQRSTSLAAHPRELILNTYHICTKTLREQLSKYFKK